MLACNYDEAREVDKQKNSKTTQSTHNASPGQKAEEKHATTRGKYLKSIVYGGLDGTITTFAAAAGVAGASLSPGVVIIVGFANLLADGLSMSIGDYLSSKSQAEYESTERTRETWEVENYLEGEKQELQEIYEARGMSKEDAKATVDIIAKDKEALVDTMMVDELGIIPSNYSPLIGAIATFISFAVFGFVPIAGYVLALFIPALDPFRFLLACLLTGVTLFTLGALKTTLTGKNWFKSGFEMLLIGGVAASAAYFVGLLLGGLA